MTKLHATDQLEKLQYQAAGRGSPVTIRAILIGLLLIPINSYWHIQMTLVWLMNFPAILTLLFNVIFILFILVAINHPLKKYVPQVAFRQGELLIIYIMLCVATALSGYDMMQCLVSLIGTGTWYATPENEWIELFGRHLPDWLVIKDKGILTPFYEGATIWYILSSPDSLISHRVFLPKPLERGINLCP